MVLLYEYTPLNAATHVDPDLCFDTCPIYELTRNIRGWTLISGVGGRARNNMEGTAAAPSYDPLRFDDHYRLTSPFDGINRNSDAHARNAMHIYMNVDAGTYYKPFIVHSTGGSLISVCRFDGVRVSA